jgi:hypothetical protein
VQVEVVLGRPGRDGLNRKSIRRQHGRTRGGKT